MTAAAPLREGDTVADFEAVRSDGSAAHLSALLHDGPLLLIFLRGVF
jgi:hypothetical protein